MKHFKLFSLIGVCFMFLLSCQNGDEPKVEDVILNSDELGESVIAESITPVSVTIKAGGHYREICISENRESLEKIMNNSFDPYPYLMPIDVELIETSELSSHKTIYDLKPSTTYYYFVTDDNLQPYTPRRFSPIHSFETEDINLYVNMGGSIEWCGVNYLENRGVFNYEQFLSSSLFESKELPHPKEEVIEGDWRYPTLQELQELSETAKVTMIDIRKNFVRITSTDGNNLYVPFTYQKPDDLNSAGSKKLMLIPADDKESGLIVRVYDMWLSELYGWGSYVLIGDKLKGYKLDIEKHSYNSNIGTTNFFYWSYIYVPDSGNEKVRKGVEERGVRFVRQNIK